MVFPAALFVCPVVVFVPAARFGCFSRLPRLHLTGTWGGNGLLKGNVDRARLMGAGHAWTGRAGEAWVGQGCGEARQGWCALVARMGGQMGARVSEWAGVYLKTFMGRVSTSKCGGGLD